ncbi:MAG: alpha/beta hydrolase-fold protein [Pseudomonadota bacterium]
MKYLLLLIALLVGTAHADDFPTSPLHGLRDIDYQRVESAELERGFHIYVSKPEGYADEDRDYPTLYLLDGGGLFPMLSAYYRYVEFSEDVPKMLIVGISYGSRNFAGGNYRSTDFTAPSIERDFWGGAPAFQSFLETSLIPLIEQKYRSDPDRRIVFGHSLGGQFSLYSAQTDPGLFWGHIASNPALHRNLDFYLATTPPAAAGARLFVGAGTNDDPQFREPLLLWIDHWTRREPTLTLEVRQFEGHSHMSTPPYVFLEGIRWLFAGSD